MSEYKKQFAKGCLKQLIEIKNDLNLVTNLDQLKITKNHHLEMMSISKNAQSQFLLLDGETDGEVNTLEWAYRVYAFTNDLDDVSAMIEMIDLFIHIHKEEKP